MGLTISWMLSQLIVLNAGIFEDPDPTHWLDRFPFPTHFMTVDLASISIVIIGPYIWFCSS